MMFIRLKINEYLLADIGVWNTDERRLNEDVDEVQIRYKVYDLAHSPPYRHEKVTMDDLIEIGEVWHDQEGDAATLTAAVMGVLDPAKHFREGVHP